MARASSCDMTVKLEGNASWHSIALVVTRAQLASTWSPLVLVAQTLPQLVQVWSPCCRLASHPTHAWQPSPCSPPPCVRPPACGGACPAGETLVEPCGATNDRVCAPEVHAACARKAVTLDVASLNAITEDHCDDCATRLPHINTALKEGYMACPLRLSAFIAQARHATDGFQVMVSHTKQLDGTRVSASRCFLLICFPPSSSSITGKLLLLRCRRHPPSACQL